VGGIGMSALARYFVSIGKTVSGYDRSPSALTAVLQTEGVNIIFDDIVELIDPHFLDKKNTLVVYTPAVNPDNSILKYFRENDFEIKKRSEILGLITDNYKTIAVAGTHGKTSTSSLIAHLLYQSSVGCTALLGGIAKNYLNNFLFNASSEIAVTEADEYDKSFLRLRPYSAVITSADADHLDIYGNQESLIDAFGEFAALTRPEGTLLIKKDIQTKLKSSTIKSAITYSLLDSSADVYAENIRFEKDKMFFDLITPDSNVRKLEMTATGLINIENAVAAAFMALQAGINEDELRIGLRSFNGVVRRFDRQFVSNDVIYIDDYAHHPEEIKALVNSVRAIYPDKKMTGIFQPHLYTRTRDFADGFAQSLDLLDEIILLDIYPARELPIENVSSKLIFNKITRQEKHLINKTELPEFLIGKHLEILLTIGAGDIDRLVAPIRLMLQNQFKTQQS
jgi:UDP-N-acetylmuramate--alanine ligase